MKLFNKLIAKFRSLYKSEQPKIEILKGAPHEWHLVDDRLCTWKCQRCSGYYQDRLLFVKHIFADAASSPGPYALGNLNTYAFGLKGDDYSCDEYKAAQMDKDK